MLSLTVRAPAEHGFQEQGLTQVNTWVDLSGSVCAYGYVGADARWIRWPNVVAFRFDDLGAVQAFPESHASPGRILDLFRRSVEPLALQAIGYETLHGSAVATRSGLIGFCGERRTGKSTIAYALSRLGCRQHSDDTIVLLAERQPIRALALPFSVRLRPEAAAFFRVDETAGRDVHVGDDASTTALAALFVLRRISAGEPRLERLTPAAACTALLAHAHCFNPQDLDGRRRLLQHYLEIAATVPVHALHFRSDLTRLDSVLARIREAVNEALEPDLVCSE
jgi:hypothetical protein